MLYWIDPVDAADRLGAKLELAGIFYFHYERQESDCRSRDQQNEHLVVSIQEAQLIDMHRVPFIHLLYADKSFSLQHRGHYPIYGT